MLYYSGQTPCRRDFNGQRRVGVEGDSFLAGFQVEADPHHGRLSASPLAGGRRLPRRERKSPLLLFVTTLFGFINKSK